jgi:hypothetical protein
MDLMAIVFPIHNTSLFFTSESDSKCELAPTHRQRQYIHMAPWPHLCVASWNRAVARPSFIILDHPLCLLTLPPQDPHRLYFLGFL